MGIAQILIKRRLKSNLKFLFYLRTEGQLLSKQPGSPMIFPKCTLTLCKALCCLGYLICFSFLFFYVYSRMRIFKLKGRHTVCESCLCCCDAALLTAPHVVCCDYRSICAFPHLHFTHFLKTSQVSLHCSQYDYIY